MLDSRISASSVPKIVPPVIASSVSVTVKVMPSRKRYGADRRMTSQSNPESIRYPAGSVPGLRHADGGEEPGDPHPALQRAHDDDHHEVGEEVDDRGGGE